jgi:hypothetical protein
MFDFRIRAKGGLPSLSLLVCLTSIASCTPPIGPPVVPDRSMLDAVRSMEAPSNPGRREALEAYLRHLGVSYEAESFIIAPREDYPRTEGVNLVVTIGSGSGDIVIGAHYDAAWLPGGVLSRGAIDNAASVAILARLAEVLGHENLEHRVRIVFFDMEEIGLAGSGHYLADHADDTIVAGINLDVNGYGDTVFYGPASSPGNALLFALMRDHCAGQGLDCVEAPAYPMSDYISFQRQGIPNISFSTFPAIEAHTLWLFLNGGGDAFAAGFVPRVLRVIHSPDDTSDLVEPAAMELSLRSLAGYVRRLDEALE